MVKATLIGPTIPTGCSYYTEAAALSSDGRLLVLCRDVIVADPNSGSVLKRFAYPHPEVLQAPIVPDGSGGFWVERNIWDGPDNSWVDHYDSNGQRLQRMEGYELEGAWGTTLVVAPYYYGAGGFSQLGITFVRLSDGKILRDYRDADSVLGPLYREACGKLVTLRYYIGFEGAEVTLDGWNTASYEPGDYLWAIRAGGQCWGLLSDHHGGHFARFGATGIDARSPEFPDAQNGMPDVPYSMNGNLWLERTLEGGVTAFQVIDTRTWQPAGTVWQLPDGCGLLDTGSDFWCAVGGSVTRVSIPVSGKLPALTPPPALTPTPTPLPTPSA